MERIFTIVFSFCIVLVFGQETKTEPQILTEVYNLSIGDSFEFDDYEIRFVEVHSDSRCPKNVNCVLEGEAIVFLEIFKKGKKITTKALEFTPVVYFPNIKGNVYHTDIIKITGVALNPYPISDNNILKSDYKLKLLFEELVQ